MSFRFLRRIRIAPGVTLNLSKSGGSLSFGPRGSKFTIGPRSKRATPGIPATGHRQQHQHVARRRLAHAPEADLSYRSSAVHRASSGAIVPRRARRRRRPPLQPPAAARGGCQLCRIRT
ncbi:MAG: DUF4236 domain-containing protein [Deltaproteobacteria bacterium]|nr:MAG: DUF4236 domain-containing protein [Deltaproteobacteria bacterium]